MKIRLQDGLPFVNVTVEHRDRQLNIDNVLVDTGSASTLFATDRLLEIGLTYEPDDSIHRIRGVGGTEFVFAKYLDRLILNNLEAVNFEIEVGAMDYGFDIDGIIGTDFLMHVDAIIDLDEMQIHSK